MTREAKARHYYEHVPERWWELMHHLRGLLQETDLHETFKWDLPVYTHRDKNVVGLRHTKKFCSLWFFYGGRLEDADEVFINAQPGKTKDMRHLRFTSVGEVDDAVVRELLERVKAV